MTSIPHIRAYAQIRDKMSLEDKDENNGSIEQGR